MMAGGASVVQGAAPSASKPLKFAHVERNFAVGTWERVLVVVWCHDTTEEGVREVRRRLKKLITEYPDGVFYLAIVAEGASLPTAGARDQLAALLREGGEHLLAGAVLIEGTGLRAAFVRGVATGLSLVAKTLFPFRACSRQEAFDTFEQKAAARSLSFDRHRFSQALGAALEQLKSNPDAVAVPSARRLL